MQASDTIIQGCHWTFAKITENLCVRAVSHKMNTKKRQKVQKEKDEIGERIGPKITENNGKSASLIIALTHSLIDLVTIMTLCTVLLISRNTLY